jgi:hypothetical protein
MPMALTSRQERESGWAKWAYLKTSAMALISTGHGQREASRAGLQGAPLEQAEVIEADGRPVWSRLQPLPSKRMFVRLISPRPPAHPTSTEGAGHLLDHVEDAARHFGRGSWQHEAHAALAAARCPRCRVRLDAEDECPRCRLTWAYQHTEADGRPRMQSCSRLGLAGRGARVNIRRRVPASGYRTMIVVVMSELTVPAM